MRSPLGLDRAKVQRDPYPYFVLQDALEPADFETLSTSFPETEILEGHSYEENQRIDLHAHYAKGLSSVWAQFVDYHCSEAFWKEILELFRENIREHYPMLFHKGFIDIWPTYRRLSVKTKLAEQCFKDGTGFLALDCQPGLNTPLSKQGRVRGPHLDNQRELFAGMLYINDSQTAFVVNELTQPVEFYGKFEIKDECCKEVARIQCKPNTLVMFLNTPKSIHSVTPRPPSSECRKLVNFCGELPCKLFERDAV